MISIIVPVYKVEKYIQTCVESILKQTYKDYELILVNDGSPDKCPEICEKYAEKYEQIIVIHKENGGLSDARNVGTSIAKGQYVTYIDSDDFVSDDYLETLIGLVEKYEADIAVTGIKLIYENKKKQDENNSDLTNQELCYTGIEALVQMLYQKDLDTSACAMLISKDIAKKHLFPYKKYHEDEYTTYKFYLEARRVTVSTKPQYFYLQRSESIMHTLGQASIDELDAADNLVSKCGGINKELYLAALSKKFSDYCQVLLSTDKLQDDDITNYKRITQFLYKKKWTILFNRKARLKNRIAALILIGGERSLRFVNNVIKRNNRRF